MRERQKERLTTITGIQIEKIRYLGIWISARGSTLKKDNYEKLLNQLKEDIEKWGRMLGKIVVLKMNILTRIIFLFQNVLIKLVQGFFQQLNRLTLAFIWQKRKTRIKNKLLTKIKERCRWRLPNWKLYYSPCALTWVKEWMVLKNKRLLYLEGHDLQAGWHACMWYNKGKMYKSFRRHIIRDALLNIWEITKRKFYMRTPR